MAEIAEKPNHASTAERFLDGGGQLGELIRSYDWSTTPLGPIAGWPQSLKTTVSLMLNSQHPMWVGWGPQNTFLYNDAYLHVLGPAKHPWALGRPASEVWAEIWDVCGPMADKVFQKGEATFVDDVRLFMRRSSDFLEETFYSFSYSPVRDESGAVGGLFCPSADVTAKNISTRRLATLSDLSANALVEKTTSAACATATAILARNLEDLPFALLYLADAAGKNLVLEAGTRLQDAPATISLEDTQPESHWLAGDVIARFEPRIVDTGHLDFPFKGPADQSIRKAVVLPLTSRAQEKPVGVLVVGVNPTRKLDAEYEAFFQLVAAQVVAAIANARASEEERKRTEALAEIDRAKTIFFSNVSHELRTPLTLMLGPLEDLLEKAAKTERTEEHKLASLAHRSGLRLLKLVNTLLDFARIEAGRIQAAFEPTDLAHYTAELASVFRSAAEKGGLRLVVNCPPLPDVVYVDRDMWEKIVLNLLSNALKFTFEGAIQVSLQWLGEEVELSVQDTGVGIPEAELPRVFERFHRVRGARSRTHEGTGIGLALVQELARLHGGDVTVTSREGAGTTFTVRIRTGKNHLPRERVQTERPNAAIGAGASAFLQEAARWLPSDGQNPETIPDLPQTPALVKQDGTSPSAAEYPHILLADDNADMRDYVSRLLGERYRVKTVSDGHAALEAIGKERPDLVLTDVMMPRLSGFGLLARLRSNPDTRTLPVIMLSARAGEEARVEGLDAGADDYLTKPFSARELMARVSSQLALSRLRREGEERISRILESITDGFQAVDKDWRLTYMNPAARKMLAAQGVDVDEIIGKHLWNEALPQAKGSESEQALTRAMTERIPIDLESYYEPWKRWYFIRAYPVQEGGLSIYFQDITDQIEAEKALRQRDELVRRTNVELNQRVTELQSVNRELQASRLAALNVMEEAVTAKEALRRRTEQFETLLNHAPLGIYLVDSRLRIREMNPAALPVFGDIPNIIGRDFNTVIHTLWPKSHADELVSRFRHTLETGEPFSVAESIETRIDRKITEYYQWRIGRITLPDGSFGVVCYFRDISSEVKARQAIHAAKEQVEAASRAKDRFLAQLSHELRTPLTPVLMTAAALCEDERLPQDVQSQLGMVKHNISLEARLIDDLLDLTRIAHGKLALRSEQCDVHALIGVVVEIVGEDAREKGTAITLDLAAERSWLSADVARLQQVFWNLLRNAVKFTPRGGQIEIRSHNVADGADGRICIEVRDNGVGFDTEAAERIFQPFEQDDRVHQGGLGLGLAIARAILDLHRGTISAASAGPGKGAIFTVEIPGAVARRSPTSAPARPTTGGNGSDTSVTSLRLLVVEDHESTLQVLVRLLTRSGHHVTAAKCLAEAKAAAANERFDLVISDLGLPDGTGTELMSELRAKYGLTGIALSGYGMEEDIHRSQEAGFLAHLVKPIDVAELRRAIVHVKSTPVT